MPDAPTVPVVAPAEPAAAPSSPPPAHATDQVDPRVPSLIKRLFDYVEPDEEKKKEEEPAAPAAAAGGGAPGKPVEPATPPISIRKEKVKRPVVPGDPVPAPAAPRAPSTPEPEHRVDPNWEKTLEENEREMLADARELEKTLPQKYAGFAARTEKFLRDHAEKVAGDEFNPDSPEYRTWLDQNQPRLTRKEIREFEEIRVAARLKPEFQARYDDLQHTIFSRAEEPQIEAAGQRTFNELANSALPAEILEAVKKVGYEKASETYKLELETAQEVLAAATDDIKEFMRVSRVDPATRRALVAEATDPTNPKFAQHERLRAIMKDVCENFKATAPQEQQLVNGKWFATREEWKRIQEKRPDLLHQWWTFSNQQIIDRAKGNLKAVVDQAIKQKREWIEARGFGRKAAPPPGKANPAPVSTPPAAPRAAPIPSAPANGTVSNDRAARIAAALNKG